MAKRAAVLTVSDGVASGARPDRSGELLAAGLAQLGFEVVRREVVPDERARIADVLREWASAGLADLVVTTGGTGLGPRDVTPEALGDVMERELPGYGELLRADGLRFTPMSVLSRSRAVTLGTVLIVALPGSPRAVEQGIQALAPTLFHALDLLSGKTEH